MALIDGKKFNEIIAKYNCENKVFGEVGRQIFNNYFLNNYEQAGRCLIMISNKSNRRLFLCKKYRCFELELRFWRMPEYLANGNKSLIQLEFDSAEEISFREFKKRVVMDRHEDKLLREANEIINPVYKI